MHARRDLGPRCWRGSGSGSWSTHGSTALLTKPPADFGTAICAKRHWFTPSDSLYRKSDALARRYEFLPDFTPRSLTLPRDPRPKR
jgi:hypothetical protein